MVLALSNIYHVMNVTLLCRNVPGGGLKGHSIRTTVYSMIVCDIVCDNFLLPNTKDSPMILIIFVKYVLATIRYVHVLH